jgi:hypothetical protein
MRILGIVALGAALGGCASSAADITPAYISPVAYQTYTCQQLALEAQAISTRAAALSGAQDSQHTKDGWTTAAAVVIFWPAAFFVGGDKQTAAELAQMKFLRSHEGIVSGGKVNWLINGFCGKGLPTIDLAHVDLP